jgi:predicted ATPase/class 3 adenylate cyclase
VEQRKTVTVLFCDMVGSTPLGEGLDPETLRRIMNRYHAVARESIERHGGTVDRFIGDAVMAVFGIPLRREDDALRAVRAALDLRQSLARLNAQLEEGGITLAIRIGVNTGEVFASSDDAETIAVGDAVNVAARLEQTAETGTIVIGPSTERLVRHAADLESLGLIELKGKSNPVAAWRLVGLAEHTEAVARHLDSPLVGRVEEIDQLESALERAVNQRNCQLVTVIAPAGTGKSRLTREFVQRVEGRARVAAGRCLSYGEGITYWPVVQVIKILAGVADTDDPQTIVERVGRLAGVDVGRDGEAELVRDRIVGLLGLTEAPSLPEETFWAVRRLVERHSDQPLVVVIEDIHWAEDTLLDLLEYLGGWTRDAPLLLLCLARPDIGEMRPGWGTGAPNATTIVLKPLGDLQADALIDNLLGVTSGGAAEEPWRQRVISVADGNPLFVEELVRMLLDEGSLRVEEGRCVADRDLAEVEMPPTVEALISARIDRLPTFERPILERGAVIGKTFYWGAVGALSPDTERQAIGTHLQALVRRDMIQPDASDLPGEDAFRFLHILVRDAAYRAIGKEARADLHRRVADWLEARAGGRLPEFDEVIGYHLEQAARAVIGLGFLDDAARTLRDRAVEQLAVVGHRALARGDMPAAASLLGRAAELAPPGAQRARLLVDFGFAEVQSGELIAADEALATAMQVAETAGSRELVEEARIEREFLKAQTQPEGWTESATAVADAALEVFEETGDELGQARAWRLRAEISWVTCQFGENAQQLERALDHAKHAAEHREVDEIMAFLASSLLFGPTPVDEAIARIDEMQTQAVGRLRLEASLLAWSGYLRAMRGEIDEGRRRYRRSRQTLEELGMRFAIAHGTVVGAGIELLAGDPAEAEQLLRGGFVQLEAMGAPAAASTVAAWLAQALADQQRWDDAIAMAHTSQDLAAEDDIVSQVIWRGACARGVAATGNIEEAQALADEAISLARSADDPRMLGQALVALSVARLAAGREQEATAALLEAREAYAAKGDRVSLERTEVVRAPQ